MNAADKRIGMPQIGNRQRPADAMEIVGAALLIFRFLEIGQHIVIAPAAVAVLAPAIVILVLAAHVEQAVDRARSAQHLAARLKHTSPVQSRLRLGLVHPVDGFFLEQLAVADRHVDPDIAVLRARLEQQHRIFSVGAEAIGQHAAGRSRADDDIVEFNNFGQFCCSHRVSGYRKRGILFADFRRTLVRERPAAIVAAILALVLAQAGMHFS